jgi:hypothetical protein
MMMIPFTDRLMVVHHHPYPSGDAIKTESKHTHKYHSIGKLLFAKGISTLNTLLIHTCSISLEHARRE